MEQIDDIGAVLKLKPRRANSLAKRYREANASPPAEVMIRASDLSAASYTPNPERSRPRSRLRAKTTESDCLLIGSWSDEADARTPGWWRRRRGPTRGDDVVPGSDHHLKREITIRD